MTSNHAYLDMDNILIKHYTGQIINNIIEYICFFLSGTAHTETGENKRQANAIVVYVFRL